MLTSKQRSKLKGMANGYDPLIYIGKEGLSENILKEADVLLEKRELIKVQVQRGCEHSAREVCDAFCKHLNCDPVLVIGGKFIIYRQAKEDSRNLLD